MYLQLRVDVMTAQGELEVLLLLLGEKEEEVEGTLEDMREVRSMYRLQMDELLEKAVAVAVGGNVNTTIDTNVDIVDTDTASAVEKPSTAPVSK